VRRFYANRSWNVVRGVELKWTKNSQIDATAVLFGCPVFFNSGVSEVIIVVGFRDPS
jgi:hypothetical protein